LPADRHEDYGVPPPSDQSGSLYEHGLRAVRRGWRLGPHELPLIGTGDWNDGLNWVGSEGKGESVWLAWFQIAVLHRFAAVADRRNDGAAAAECRGRAERLREAVERHGWDGAWYRRAFFDDGSPLGSAGNDECRIDSIAQSWAVLSGVADPDRAARGMDEAVRQLVRPADRLALLFTPPFDAGHLQPGYVKGYVPGVRENGGQYTHAATWLVKALAALGRGDEAYATFDLLNPITATASGAAAAKYKGEPYAVAADVYSNPAHVGRAGWTWYTGSAGWLYRVGLEDVLGVRREGDVLRIDPCVPAAWTRFAVHYRFGSTTYRVEVTNPDRVCRGVRRVEVDGAAAADGRIPLRDDGRSHDVRVTLGATESGDTGVTPTRKAADELAAAG
jgi:cyclic beta-1,2-glucan synthetase